MCSVCFAQLQGNVESVGRKNVVGLLTVTELSQSGSGRLSFKSQAMNKKSKTKKTQHEEHRPQATPVQVLV